MLSIIGVGGAGSKVVESLFKKNIFKAIIQKLYEKSDEIRGVAIDTSDSIKQLSSIPKENRVLVGSSRVKGKGTGGDVELARIIMEEELEIAMQAIRRANPTKPDVFFVVAGLGGGTGTGGMPVIAESIRVVYKVPVVGILILPSRTEGYVYIKNVYENFDRIVDKLDGCIVLDNNVLVSRGEDIVGAYKYINSSIYNLLHLIPPIEIYRFVKGNISTFGIMTTKDDISVKDALETIVRNYTYFNLKEFKEASFIAIGDLSKLHGQNYGREWCKRKFNAELEYIFKDYLDAKHLDICIMFNNIGDVLEDFETKIKEKESSQKIPKELEELFDDIKPLF